MIPKPGPTPVKALALAAPEASSPSGSQTGTAELAAQKPSQQRPKSACGPRGVPSLKAWYSQRSAEGVAPENGSRQSTPRSAMSDGLKCTPRSTAIGGAVCPAAVMNKRPQSAGPSRFADLRGIPGSPGFGLKQKVRDLEARLAKEVGEAREDVEKAKQEKIIKGNGLSRSEAEALVAETKREIIDSFDKKRSEFGKFWVQQNVDNKRFQDQLNQIQTGNHENESRMESLRRRISDLATECGVGVEYDDDLQAVPR